MAHRLTQASYASIRYLSGRFPGRLMSKQGDFPWSPISPDLAICDFFLLGYLKHQKCNVPIGYQTKNLRERRDAIQRERGNLERDMIEQAYKGMVHRARRCLQVRGRT